MRIRVDPTILRQSSGNISGVGNNITQTGQSVLGVSRNAPSYNGQFGPRVQAIGQEAFARAQGISSRLNNCSYTLQNKAQMFEAADMVGVVGFVPITTTFSAWSGSTNLTSQVSSYFSLGSLLNPDLGNLPATLKTGKDTWGVIKEPLENMRYIDWRAAGRWMNDFIGNQKGGFVGGMDQLGHIINSWQFRGTVTILGGVIGFLNDPERTTNPQRAGWTAAAETGIDYAIGATGVGGVVLAVNSGIQLFGSLAGSGARIEGNLFGGEWQQIFGDQAQSLDDNFDRIDLGNITHDLAHIVVDQFTNPFMVLLNPAIAPIAISIYAVQLATGQITATQLIDQSHTAATQTQSDLNSLWKHVSDLPDGIVDITGNLITLKGMEVIAENDKFFSFLPVPENWKDTVHQTAIETAKLFDKPKGPGGGGGGAW